LFLAHQKFHAVKVSCGNDHVIVLIRDKGTQEGEDTPTNSFASTVFSWGIMASGRLGHGRPRNVTESGSKRKARAITSERYESKPTVILALDDEQITDIAAGKHHSLAISKDGRVFAWGSNSFGQCGVAQNDTHHSELVRVRGNNTDSKEDKTPGILEDVWLPRHLTEFGPMTGKRIISISAGGIHSAAIDSDGKLYSWGGGGDNYCLGHGDSFAYRNGFDLPSESRRRKLLAMAGCLEVPSWGSPREIKCLTGERIRYVDLGEYDGAAISESGRMYVWGDKWFKLKQVRTQSSKEHLY
jgi:alpha-tubulin suppressor-like RCC1 family protein